MHAIVALGLLRHNYSMTRVISSKARWVSVITLKYHFPVFDFSSF